jgi:hypothetical protein
MDKLLGKEFLKDTVMSSSSRLIFIPNLLQFAHGRI